MKKAREATPNILLKQERLLRGWSQKKLAELLGTDVDPQNIRRWEQGHTVPARYYQERLCAIFGKTAAELGFITISQQPDQGVDVADQLQPADHLSPLVDVLAARGLPTASSPIWNIPYRRNPFFTGREDILQYLHDTLTSNKTAALTQAYAMSGLGGIGKTLTAVEYAYRYRDEYQAVLWARADTHELLTADFVTIAGLINLSEKTDPDQNHVVQAIKQWLNQRTGWLLILDNADDLEIVSEFIPTLGSGHTLLTTRMHATGSIARAIEIRKMEVDESTRMLLRRAKLIENDTQLEEISEDDLSKASIISLLMDGLPLALDQAGAYIEETGSGLGSYLDLYQTRRMELLQRRGRSISNHPEPVATTWSLSFERVKQANPAAAELLQLCAFLHPDAIPEEMLMDGAATLGPILQPVAEDALTLNETIADILRYSLVRRDFHSQTLIIHRLVQDVLKDQMDHDLSLQWIRRVVRLLYTAFPDGDFASWDRCQRYLPHVQTCASLIQQYPIMQPEVTQLFSRAANYLIKRSQFAEAEPLLLQALRSQEQLFGPQHIDTVEALNELALLYYQQGKYAEAEALYHQVLSAYEQQPPSRQLDVAKTLHNLADLYCGQGRYSESEIRYQQALTIYEKYGDPLNVSLAESLDSLGDLYSILGRYKDAEILHRRALAILEHSLGAEHPDTARSLDNLGVLYLHLGRYEEAESFSKRALAIREQVLGSQHRYIATSLNNLSVVYRRQGRHSEAERLLQRALTIREQVLGPEHPDTANILNNLALVYKEQGRFEEANRLLQRALAICELQLGQENLYTAVSLNNLAMLYHAQQEYDKAASLYHQALTIYDQQLKSIHPRTALSLRGLASLCQQQERYEEAEAFFRQALTIYEQMLGSEHPDTQATLEDYASLLRIMDSKTVPQSQKS